MSDTLKRLRAHLEMGHRAYPAELLKEAVAELEAACGNERLASEQAHKNRMEANGLRDALLRYCRHGAYCELAQAIPAEDEDEYACTCGLSSALREGGGA